MKSNNIQMVVGKEECGKENALDNVGERTLNIASFSKIAEA
jgi:hypothetical protein